MINFIKSLVIYFVVPVLFCVSKSVVAGDNCAKARQALKDAGLADEVFTNQISLTQKAEIKFAALLKKPHFCNFLGSIEPKLLGRPWIRVLLPLWYDFPKTESNRLKGALALASTGKELIQIEETSYKIIKLGEYFFAINSFLPLNSGGFGDAYMAYKLDKEGKILATSPYIAKLAKDKNSLKMSQLEVRNSNRALTEALGPVEYYDPKLKRNGHLIFQEYIVGQDLGENNGFVKLHNLLKEKSPLDRARFAVELGMELANIHKVGLLHGDVKGQNIRMHERSVDQNIWLHERRVEKLVEKINESAFDIRLIDFGASADISNIKNEKDSIEFANGTVAFVAPEIFLEQKAYSTTDLFSSAPIFMAIYGAPNPLSNMDKEKSRLSLLEKLFQLGKDPPHSQLRAVLKRVRFTSDGMMSNTGEGRGYDDGVDRRWAIDFYKRLGKFNYRKRPSYDQLLKFNNCFYQYERMLSLPAEFDKNAVELQSLKCRFIANDYELAKNDFRAIIKNTQLDIINEFVNSLSDETKILEITKLALRGNHFDKNFDATGNFLWAIRYLANTGNKPNVFHWLGNTNAYMEYKNAAELAISIRKKILNPRGDKASELSPKVDRPTEEYRNLKNDSAAMVPDSEPIKKALAFYAAEKDLKTLIESGAQGFDDFKNAYNELEHFSPRFGFWKQADVEPFLGKFRASLATVNASQLVENFIFVSNLFKPSREQAAIIRQKAKAIFDRVNELMRIYNGNRDDANQATIQNLKPKKIDLDL